MFYEALKCTISVYFVKMSLNKTPQFANVSKRFLQNNKPVKQWTSSAFSTDLKGTDAEKPRIQVKKTFNQPPLSESLPNLPKAIYEAGRDGKQATKVTRLKNGLRVASENRFGQFCTLGVVVDAGPRYEVSYPSGVSHFLEKLAFQSTSKYENKEAIQKELEKYGGIGDCQITRDVGIYAASVMRDGIDPVVGLIADITLRPKLSFEEITEAQQTINYELETLKTKSEQDILLVDMIHAAAYRDNTLGLPKLCLEKNVLIIDQSILTTYLKNHYSPSRMVIGGVGVDHDELVAAASKYFVDEKPMWETEQKHLVKDVSCYNADKSIAQYTGGIIKESCDLPQLNVSGLPEVAHVVIGFEGTSFNDEDYVPLCVLNMMMGGGGSFSAGGPGKGMFTRLYVNVLNKHHWITSATAYNYAYHDSGLFCVHASATPENIGNMTEVIIKELLNMNSHYFVGEIERAKKQLQSMLLMNLETKPVVFEDMTRQVLANGFRKQPDSYIRLIERVKVDDIQRVATRVLSSPISVAARGNIAKLPSFEDIQSALSGGGKLKEKQATA